MTTPAVRKILARLKKSYPHPACALIHQNPFELVVATVLSAQCTDKRVNMVTPELFRAYPTPKAMAAAALPDLERLIQSIGFFRAKAKNLQGLAQTLERDFHGQVPRTLDELIRLPGVGRKTANVVLGVAFGIATGVVVDTHVRRISKRLGLTTSDNVEVIERDLMRELPRQEWIDFSHRIILHGRAICIARKPKCLECPLLSLCPRVGLPPLQPASPGSR
jgi:endonuclease-3